MKPAGDLNGLHAAPMPRQVGKLRSWLHPRPRPSRGRKLDRFTALRLG